MRAVTRTILVGLISSGAVFAAKRADTPPLAVHLYRISASPASDGSESAPAFMVAAGNEGSGYVVCLRVGEPRLAVETVRVRLYDAARPSRTRAEAVNLGAEIVAPYLKSGLVSTLVTFGGRLLARRAAWRRKVTLRAWRELEPGVWITELPRLMTNGHSQLEVQKIVLRRRPTGKKTIVKPPVTLLWLPRAVTAPEQLAAELERAANEHDRPGAASGPYRRISPIAEATAR